jgi:hypothetical protein
VKVLLSENWEAHAEAQAPLEAQHMKAVHSFGVLAQAHIV